MPSRTPDGSHLTSWRVAMRRFANPVTLLTRLQAGGAGWSSLVRGPRLVQVGDWITSA